MKNGNKHLFALHLPAGNQIRGSEIVLIDEAFVRRIQKIVRLSVGDSCILFTRTHHTQATVVRSEKKKVIFSLEQVSENVHFKPFITYLLPLLKRDALETALQSLTEAGVQDIELIETSKIHRKWGSQKELDRLQRIIVAAAEQSKNFSYAVLRDPISLPEALKKDSVSGFYGDPSGKPLHAYENALSQSQLFLSTGPEGDFTPEEKQLLQQHSFRPVSLTPTILRAETAALVLASFFRSLSS